MKAICISCKKAHAGKCPKTHAQIMQRRRVKEVLAYIAQLRAERKQA